MSADQAVPDDVVIDENYTQAPCVLCYLPFMLLAKQCGRKTTRSTLEQQELVKEAAFPGVCVFGRCRI